MAEEGDIPSVRGYRQGVVVKWVLGDLLALTQQLRHARIPRRKYGWSQITGYDDFYADDPLPFFTGVALSIRKYLMTRRAPAHEMDPDLDNI
jgi:predicted ATP-grasp superfamily ATP-dependent carboligase